MLDDHKPRLPIEDIRCYQRIRRSGGLIFRWFVFLAVVVAVNVSAQEVRETAKPESAQAQDADERPAEEEVTEGAPETFDPTEEVSEDYSIEFPVDI